MVEEHGDRGISILFANWAVFKESLNLRVLPNDQLQHCSLRCAQYLETLRERFVSCD